MISSETSSKSTNRKYDYTLLVALCLLLVTGLVILYSTSAYNGEVKFHDPFYYLKKQLFASGLGIAGMFLIANIDYHFWQRLAVLGYITAILLSVAVIFVGDEYNGSKRWLSLGPFSFQPSEFAKVALILFLAWLVERNVKKIGSMRTLLAIVVTILPIVALVGASNLSTAIIILGIGNPYICRESQIRSVFRNGFFGSRIYDYFPCAGELSVRTTENLASSGKLRKGLSDASRALCHRFRRSLWERTWRKCAKTRVCAGSAKRYDLLYHL